MLPVSDVMLFFFWMACFTVSEYVLSNRVNQLWAGQQHGLGLHPKINSIIKFYCTLHVDKKMFEAKDVDLMPTASSGKSLNSNMTRPRVRVQLICKNFIFRLWKRCVEGCSSGGSSSLQNPDADASAFCPVVAGGGGAEVSAPPTSDDANNGAPSGGGSTGRGGSLPNAGSSPAATAGVGGGVGQNNPVSSSLLVLNKPTPPHTLAGLAGLLQGHQAAAAANVDASPNPSQTSLSGRRPQQMQPQPPQEKVVKAMVRMDGYDVESVTHLNTPLHFRLSTPFRCMTTSTSAVGLTPSGPTRVGARAEEGTTGKTGFRTRGWRGWSCTGGRPVTGKSYSDRT